MSSRASAIRVPSQPRRGLSRLEAAAYVGVGVTTFDGMVGRGELPTPIRIGARVLWDMKANLPKRRAA